MPRWAIAAIVAVLALLVASQLLVPGIAERGVENRLTEGGGTASVSLSAFPAVRLLFDDGSRFEARASGLNLDLEERVDVLDRLDGFDEVDVSIVDVIARPLDVETFRLTRDGSRPYHLVSRRRRRPPSSSLSARTPLASREESSSAGSPGRRWGMPRFRSSWTWSWFRAQTASRSPPAVAPSRASQQGQLAS